MLEVSSPSITGWLSFQQLIFPEDVESFNVLCLSLCCLWTSSRLFFPRLIQSGRAVFVLSACREVIDALTLTVNCLCGSVSGRHCYAGQQQSSDFKCSKSHHESGHCCKNHFSRERRLFLNVFNEWATGLKHTEYISYITMSFFVLLWVQSIVIKTKNIPNIKHQNKIKHQFYKQKRQ